jgi:hypothetical protein
LRKTSFPASEHIIFLETKLEESEKSQYSPNTGLLLKDKVKGLETENNRLQDILAQLEHEFETRLRDSVEHKTCVEMKLRRNIQQLEDENASKNDQIRDLENRNDASQRDLSIAKAWKAAVERLESEKRSLEETNRSLEKRNNVLTELLGQSPTRSHHGFELPSPTREHHKRTPRPRSMMPRIPSSPSHSVSNRPLSLHTSPSSFQHDYFSPHTALNREHDHPCNGRKGDPQKLCDDSQSIDSGLGESCSVRSGNEPMSKRSSMHSYASASPAAWGLPLPPSPTADTAERYNRKRKTRRFASGSTQLKPLVLPTLNPGPSLPQSAPIPDLYSSLKRRDMSGNWIDPTISFLSQPYDTPTQPRRRSTTGAAEDALKALEGTAEIQFISFEDELAHGEALQPMPDCNLNSEEVPTFTDYHFHPNYFSPKLVDEVIPEEDGTAFLNHQVEDSRDQSFSSLVGEVSITESDIDRGQIEEHILTTQFPESELSRPTNLQLPTQPTTRSPWEELLVDNDPGGNPNAYQAYQQSIFSPTLMEERDFVNPLVSPDHLPNVNFQFDESSSPAMTYSDDWYERLHQPTHSCSGALPCEKPTQIKRNPTDVGLQKAEMIMTNPLKAAPSLSKLKTPQRSHSPLDLLQCKGSPTSSVSSVTTRTIFGSISRYTSYMREIKRDPTALARRVIANAWCSNWKRFGKLSWWVLGLFLGPGWKQKVEKKKGWEAYDGENIVQAEHERLNSPGQSLEQDRPRRSPTKPRIPRQLSRFQPKKVNFIDARQKGATWANRHRQVQQVECKSCEQRSKASWGKSLYLWGKFSVAIMLAVGGAVFNGPEEMLKDCDLHIDAATDTQSGLGHDLPDASETDHDTPFDYSLEIEDDDDKGNGQDEDDLIVNEEMSLQSFQTPKSIIPCNPSSAAGNHYSPPSTLRLLSTNNETSYTFGAPSNDEYDYADDNSQTRPTRSRVPQHHIPLDPQRTLPQLLDNNFRIMREDEWRGGEDHEEIHHPSRDLGTLLWMQNLSIRDFEPSSPAYDYDDGQRTIRPRPSPRKGADAKRKSLHVLLSGG